VVSGIYRDGWFAFANWLKRHEAATFMMFIVPTLLVQAVAIAVVFTMSLAGWAAYKLLLERGRIDLSSRPHVQELP